MLHGHNMLYASMQYSCIKPCGMYSCITHVIITSNRMKSIVTWNQQHVSQMSTKRVCIAMDAESYVHDNNM